MDALVLLRLASARAEAQLGQVQSHSGTPPILAVPSTVISIGSNSLISNKRSLEKETLLKIRAVERTVEPVYEPHDDSYLLAEAVDERVYGKVLDMGTGSGIQAVTAALKKDVREVTAVDISNDALRKADKRARSEGIRRKIKFIRSDLFNNISGKFDWIIFNPPYLPSEGEADELSWAGGKKGFEVIARFLGEAKRYLNEDGSILMVYSSLTNLDLTEYDYDVEIIRKKKLFFEELFVARLSHL
jgi:release factor glutamine methyltransferase